MSRRFVDRADAGRALAAELTDSVREQAIVLGLPRGGVPVAAKVAEALGAPLDILVVRKIGVPSQPEVAMGAIASIAGSIVTVRNESVLQTVGPDARRRFDEVAARERVELERRQELYRAGLPPLEVAGRRVVVVDDGIATGATMRAALLALAPARAASTDVAEGEGPASVIVAVPVGPTDTLSGLATLADRVVCVWVLEPFWAVGQAYVDFTQTTDDEVVRLLAAQAG